jgi:hypothetical protein
MLATTIHKSNTTPHHQRGATTKSYPRFPTTGRRDSGPVASKPNSVSGNPSPASDESKPVPAKRLLLHQNRTHYRPTVHPLESPRSPNPHTMWAGLSLVVLLRKEVIQPHLPVRLPCYDFVPIADPTFDGSPPYGLGHRLRVLPTFMT